MPLLTPMLCAKMSCTVHVCSPPTFLPCPLKSVSHRQATLIGSSSAQTPRPNGKEQALWWFFSEEVAFSILNHQFGGWVWVGVEGSCGNHRLQHPRVPSPKCHRVLRR